MEALQSKKIFDVAPLELVDMVAISVARAFADTGKRIDQNLNEQLDYIVQTLPGNLKRLLPSLRIKEIPIAIERGICKEFGEYFGINVAELFRFCKSHYESDIRANTAKKVLKPIPLPANIPSLESQFYTAKGNCVEALTRLQEKKDFERMAPACYDFLNKLKLIIFTIAEKYEFKKDASIMIATEHKTKLAVIAEDYKRRPITKIINEIEAGIECGKPISEEVNGMILLKAKTLTLKAFFNEIIESELNLSTLIDNKKDLFINEKGI